MILLGSTGSIGVNALNIAKEFSIEVELLVGGYNIDLLNRQIAQFNPRSVVVAKKDDIKRVNHKNVKFGEDAIIEEIASSKSDIVVNALVGFLGLRPTIKAIELGKRVALANKESLVIAGGLLDKSKIFPIDSEHFGLWYLMQKKLPQRLIITASGGAFRDTKIEQIRDKSAKEALNHPNWSMGKKITIDSATMVNKLFEILEAYWLFGFKNIDALIETKSLIHALIDFVDGSTTAHIATTDMRLPIAYAIRGDVKTKIVEHIDFTKVGTLEFREIESGRYPMWSIKDDLLENPHKGVVLNGANELFVEHFLRGDIRFGDLYKGLLWAYENIESHPNSSLDELIEKDKESRRKSSEYIKKLSF